MILPLLVEVVARAPLYYHPQMAHTLFNRLSGRGETVGFQTIYGVIFDLRETLALSTRPVAEIRREGVRRAVDFLIAQGMDLPREEFEQAYMEALQFAERKSSVEQQEHLASDTLVFLLQFYNYPHPSAELVQEAVRYTFEPDMDAYVVDPEAWSLLEHLHRREIKIGLLVNAQDDEAERRLVQHLGLAPYFDLIVTSAGQPDRPRKPNTRAWQPFIDAWDTRPHELVMVGDDLVEDILGALNARMWAIWVRRTSAGSELERAIRPDAAVNGLADVRQVLEEWEGG